MVSCSSPLALLHFLLLFCGFMGRIGGWSVVSSVSIGWVSRTSNELWEGFWWGVGLIAGEFALERGTWMRLLRSVSDMLSESESELTGSR